jgi:hypothetical protein
MPYQQNAQEPSRSAILQILVPKNLTPPKAQRTLRQPPENNHPCCKTATHTSLKIPAGDKTRFHTFFPSLLLRSSLNTCASYADNTKKMLFFRNTCH